VRLSSRGGNPPLQGEPLALQGEPLLHQGEPRRSGVRLHGINMSQRSMLKLLAVLIKHIVFFPATSQTKQEQKIELNDIRT
jgi:hypothetical protein